MNLQFEITKDATIIAKLNKTVQQKHHVAHPYRFNPYNEEKVKTWFVDFLRQEDTVAILAKADEEYIGYAVLKHRKKMTDNPFIDPDFETLYIDQISIEKAFQNQGIGDRLIEFIKTLARQKGITRIHLDVWSDNLQAKHFFQKKEFSTIREIMELELD